MQRGTTGKKKMVCDKFCMSSDRTSVDPFTPYMYDNVKFHTCYLLYTAILRKVVGKMYTRQSQEVIWDMINTLSLTRKLSGLLLLLFFCTRRHMSMDSPTILSNFFEEQGTQNHPQYLAGLLCTLFATTFYNLYTKT